MIAEPASHSYLGDQMSHVSPSHRGLLKAGEQYDVVLVPLQDVVLFPGETLPLRVHQQEYIQHLSSVLRREESPPLIGVTHILQRRRTLPTPAGDGILSRISPIGTIIEIRTAHRREEDFEELLCTSKGRQRFRIESLTQTGRILRAKVRMLDDTLPRPCDQPMCMHPLPGFVLQMASCRQLAALAYKLAMDTVFGTSASSNNTSSTADTIPAAWKRWGVNAYGFPSSSTYNSRALSASVLTNPKYSISYDSAHDMLAAADPVSFSFFLAANLPLSPPTLLTLLTADTVFERLSLLVRILRKMLAQQAVLGCATCRSPLASASACFQFPGAEGLAGAYVNSGGYVHPTCTFRRLLPSARCVVRGAPSLQDTWFPSFAWQIALCGVCWEHIGWKYTSTVVERVAVGAPCDISSVTRMLQRYRGEEEKAEDQEEGAREAEANSDGDGDAWETMSEGEEEEEDDDDDSSDASNSDEFTYLQGEEDPRAVVSELHTFWGLRRCMLLELE